MAVKTERERARERERERISIAVVNPESLCTRVCVRLAQGRYPQQRGGRELNPRPVDLKASAVTTRPSSHTCPVLLCCSLSSHVAGSLSGTSEETSAQRGNRRVFGRCNSVFGALVAVRQSAGLVSGGLPVRISAGHISHQGLLSLPSIWGR